MRVYCGGFGMVIVTFIFVAFPFFDFFLGTRLFDADLMLLGNLYLDLLSPLSLAIKGDSLLRFLSFFFALAWVLL